METLLQDFRYGVRVLARKPGFATIAILTLALGIGANSAIFSVVDSILLRPLPYPEPEQLFAVQWGAGDRVAHNSLTGLEVEFLRGQLGPSPSSGIEPMVVTGDFARANLIRGGNTQSIRSLKVSSQYFHMLRVSPQWGSGFTTADDQPEAPATAVLSHSLWVNAFGADPNVLHSSIDLNGRNYTITGILPADFESYPPAAVYLPFHLDEHDPNYAGVNYTVLARLKNGFTRERAQAQLSALSAEFIRLYPTVEGHFQNFGFLLTGYRQSIIRRSATGARDLMVLQSAVGFVLLIACANLAGLLFARGSGRRHEITIRIALGASRARVVRMLLVENLLLALAGGVVGILLAFATVPVMIAASPVQLPRNNDIHISGGTLLFTLALVLLSTLLSGLAPALRAFVEHRASLAEGARTSTTSRSQAFAGRVLMIAQTSLALVLLAGGTLMFRSFLKIIAVPPGFETQHLLTFQVPLSDARYRTTAKTAQFAENVVEKLRALPGVQAATYASGMPFVRGLNEYVVPAGRKDIEVHFATESRAVTPQYFETLRSSLLSGRAFNDHDNASSARVVIINKTLADRWWPGANPVGQSVMNGDTALEIVGVVADLHESSLDHPPEPMIIVPVTQVEDRNTAFVNRLFPASFLVRTASHVELASQIRDVVRSADGEMPIENIRPMDAVIDLSLTGPRFFGSLFGAFAAFALLLTATGTYGLLSYLVNQKNREIGVRMALGASQGRVLWQFLGQALAVSAVGVALGLLGAIALMRFLRAFLFEVAPADPLALSLAGLILAAAAFSAALFPALRATRVNPIVALRYE
jgi:predicted permease